MREASAALLGKMMRDRLVGREVEIATAKFLPPKFQINMKESPATAVAEFEGETSLDSVSGSTSRDTLLSLQFASHLVWQPRKFVASLLILVQHIVFSRRHLRESRVDLGRGISRESLRYFGENASESVHESVQQSIGHLETTERLCSALLQ